MSTTGTSETKCSAIRNDVAAVNMSSMRDVYRLLQTVFSDKDLQIACHYSGGPFQLQSPRHESLCFGGIYRPILLEEENKEIAKLK